jgi:glutamate/tyrosine decarboxylase-like PLP-dependent enzyme
MSNEFDRDALRRAGRRAINLFVENFDGPEDHEVDPGSIRQTLRDLFRGTLADEGVGVEQAVEDFAALVLPHSMRTPHPLYLGLVNTTPLPGGVLGDLLVSTLNNNGGAFHQGPALNAAEGEVVREFARLFGIADARGMFLPGGSLANLHGLLLARARHFPDWEQHGPAALRGAPVLYTSEASHFSVTRAARALGLGADNVVSIGSVGRGAIDVASLLARVQADKAAGKRPFALSATVGTTGTGAIDPVAELTTLCRAYDLWLHVDACYGGGAYLLHHDRPAALTGIEQADSVAVDPHKWFYMPMTAAIVITPHADLEERAFEIDASYIPTDGVADPYRRGILTSRRCAGGMVWLALRAHGWNTIRDAVRRNIELTRLLERRLRERGFRVLPDGELSIACARWEPDDRPAERLDDLQTRIAEHVVRCGVAWFATVRHAGRLWLRFNILNLHTRERHIERLITALERACVHVGDD